MEHNSEKTNRAPLLLIGAAIDSLCHLVRVPSLAEVTDFNKNSYYLLNFADEDLRVAIDALVQMNISREQILVCAPDGFSPSFTFDPLIGIFELPLEDLPEEARLRLLARLETQKHRKLSAEIEMSRQAGIPSELTAEEWCLRMETAHLTHAFCCSLGLPASRHSASLREALSEKPMLVDLWQSGQPMENLLPLCARLAIHHSQTPTAFREELRRLSANLPFRTRTELRDVAERCLESIWKGIPNAS